MFSSEYGWDTEYILSRTMREIDWRIKSIIARRNLDMKFEAQLHGAEIKIPKTEADSTPIKVNKEQEQAMEQAFAQAKLRKNNGR